MYANNQQSSPLCPIHNLPAIQVTSKTGNNYWKCTQKQCQSYELLNPGSQSQFNGKRPAPQPQSNYPNKRQFAPSPYPMPSDVPQPSLQMALTQLPQPPMPATPPRTDEHDKEIAVYRLLVDRIEKVEENNGNWDSLLEEMKFVREGIEEIRTLLTKTKQ